MKKVAGEVAGLLGFGVILAIALYYYLGTSNIISATGGAVSSVVTGYSTLLKPYPAVGSGS